MTKQTPVEVPILDALSNRWSPRAFADRPVEPAKLRAALEAARWAASSYNDQPWAFIVATENEPADYAKALSVLMEFNQGWAKEAPVLVLAVARQNFGHNGKPNRHSWYDLGAAVANFSTQATADGLSLHQMAGIDPEIARREFAIPADWDCVVALAVGYAGDPDALPDMLKEKELAPRSRKAQAEYAFAGTWGAAAKLG